MDATIDAVDLLKKHQIDVLGARELCDVQREAGWKLLYHAQQRLEKDLKVRVDEYLAYLKGGRDPNPEYETNVD